MPLGNINMQTGAAQQAAAFADRLEGFKRESLGRLSKASAQRGQQEGVKAAAEYVENKKAGEQADIEFRNNFGVSGQAYNKALGAAYKSSVKSDLSAGLNALAVEYQDDIATYNDMSQDLIKSTIQGADSSLQDELYLDSELINTQYQKQVQGNSIKANLKAAADEQNRAKQTIYDNSLGLLANSKTEEDAAMAAASLSSAFEVIEQQRENGEITEEQAAQQRTMMAKGFAEQSFLNTVDNAETIEQAYDSLEKLYSEVPAGWSPQDWDSVVSKAEKSYNRMARKEAAKIEASTKANKEAALFSHGQSLFDNDIRIDPKNTTDESKENLQAINSYYDGISQEWDSLPVEQYINNSVEFIERTGIMPTKLESRINAFARSGDSQQVLAAAEITGRVQEQAPQALADMSGETRAIMLSVVDAQRSGTDIDIALESARTAAYSQTQAQREEIRIKIKDVAKDLPDNLQNFLDDSSDDKWYTLGAPDASPAMSAEFRVSFEKYMNLTGGNTKNAQALAYQDLRKVWAVSDITGGYMKYAPEAMYGMPGGNNAWISQQFKDDTAGYGEGVTIAATPSTARNPRPEYALMIADDSGALTPVYDENGMPSAWQPDFTETQDYKDLQELPEKTIAASQEKRERYQAQKLNKLAGLIRSKEFLKKNKNYSNAINNALLAEEINEVEAEQLKVLFDVEQKEKSPKSAKPEGEG